MSAAADSSGRSWHRRARHALAHSLRVRLVALFLLLALGMSATFLLGMQSALRIGWSPSWAARLRWSVRNPWWSTCR